MDLFFKPIAQKELKKLPKIEARKVFKKIQILKEFPFAGKPLSVEFEGSRSVRAWPYRIIYRIQSKRDLVIETIKHRQSSYKK
jgi:mRNA-degrading endonuclease RelE of RelBE toxin-antitoxin system